MSFDEVKYEVAVATCTRGGGYSRPGSRFARARQPEGPSPRTASS